LFGGVTVVSISPAHSIHVCSYYLSPGLLRCWWPAAESKHCVFIHCASHSRSHPVACWAKYLANNSHHTSVLPAQHWPWSLSLPLDSVSSQDYRGCGCLKKSVAASKKCVSLSEIYVWGG